MAPSGRWNTRANFFNYAEQTERDPPCHATPRRPACRRSPRRTRAWRIVTIAFGSCPPPRPPARRAARAWRSELSQVPDLDQAAFTRSFGAPLRLAGYATLYGDMAGGFAPLKDVPKTLVYGSPAGATSAGPSSPSACSCAPERRAAPGPETRGQPAAVRRPRPDPGALRGAGSGPRGHRCGRLRSERWPGSYASWTATNTNAARPRPACASAAAPSVVTGVIRSARGIGRIEVLPSSTVAVVGADDRHPDRIIGGSAHNPAKQLVPRPRLDLILPAGSTPRADSLLGRHSRARPKRPGAVRLDG